MSRGVFTMLVFITRNDTFCNIKWKG